MFGHTTYEMMKSFWPTPEAAKIDPDMARVMNTSPKIVFSKTLRGVEEGPDWKNIRIRSAVHGCTCTIHSHESFETSLSHRLARQKIHQGIHGQIQLSFPCCLSSQAVTFLLQVLSHSNFINMSKLGDLLLHKSSTAELV